MIIDGKEYSDGEIQARMEMIFEQAEQWWENLADEDKITFYLELTQTETRGEIKSQTKV